jgi:hypothetical protein
LTPNRPKIPQICQSREIIFIISVQDGIISIGTSSLKQKNSSLLTVDARSRAQKGLQQPQQQQQQQQSGGVFFFSVAI